MRALCGWLLCVTLAVGCGDSGPHNITIATKALITKGMTEDQVSAIIGQPTVVPIDMGTVKVVQWSEGSGDSLRSIIVTFNNGKATQVAGTNLR